MKPESRPSSEQGLASAVNLAGLITSSPRHVWLKHASFSGSLVAEVSSLCISSVCLITLDFPQPNRETAQCGTKEVVGIHTLLTRSFFGGNPIKVLVSLLEFNHYISRTPFVMDKKIGVIFELLSPTESREVSAQLIDFQSRDERCSTWVPMSPRQPSAPALRQPKTSGDIGNADGGIRAGSAGGGG